MIFASRKLLTSPFWRRHQQRKPGKESNRFLSVRTLLLHCISCILTLVRKIDHDSLPTTVEDKILAVLTSDEVLNVEKETKAGKVSKFEKSLGNFDETHRKAVHQLVAEKCPFLVTKCCKGEISIQQNQRSFIPLMLAANYEACCQIHKISPFSPIKNITFSDTKFTSKANRTAFSMCMRKYFAKLLDFNYENNSYTVWLKERAEKSFKLVKVKRTGLEHNEMISIISKILRRVRKQYGIFSL